ncbi:MAG: M24 family metallopeptidase [Actinomycetota bacterium]
MDHENRLSRLRERLTAEGIDGLFVTDLTNIRYLSGFTGSNASLLISRDRAWFFSDGRYATQAPEQVHNADILIYTQGGQYGDLIKKALSQTALSRVGFEAANITMASSKDLQGYFEGHELVAAKGVVEELRKVKEPGELDLIRTAAEMADAGFAYIVDQVEVGKTENQIALDLEMFMRSHGAEAVSFELIVAAGERSALPHARPGDKTVEKGHYLLFDLGCVYQGYCSDLTRTIVVGPCDDRHRDVYETVRNAEMAGLDAVRIGATGAEVDKAARDVIAAAGYPEAFSHSLGHGVGLQVHEAPTLRIGGTDVLAEGNVITIEPGAYFAGWGGVRVEDLVVVSNGGAEVLSAATKELIVL